MSNVLLNDIDNTANLQRGNELVFEADRTAKLIELNKKMTEMTLEFNNIKNSANNIDYKPSKNSTILKDIQKNKVKKVEVDESQTIADRIEEFKNDSDIPKIDLANIASESSEKGEDNKTAKIELKNIIGSNNDKIEVKDEIIESIDPEETAEQLKSRQLLNEVAKIDEETKAEEKKATDTDGPKIDINNILGK